MNIPELVRSMRLRAAILRVISPSDRDEDADMFDVAAEVIEALDIRRAQVKADNISLIECIQSERRETQIMEQCLVDLITDLESRKPPSLSEIKFRATLAINGEVK